METAYMAQFDDYTQLTAPARNDVVGAIKDVSEALPENQTKYSLLEDLVKYGAFASKVLTVAASATVTLLNTDPIFVDITPTAAQNVTCPAKGDDNHPYIIRNLSGTYTLTVKQSGGATITTVAAGEVKLFIPSTINDFTTLTLASISDAELNALAGLTSAADSFPYFTGSGTASLLVIVSAIRSLLASADVATFRTNAGLAIGTNVQAYHARLADLAGITYSQGDVLYFDGTNIVKLAAGTSGQFLKTLGAGANPLWATIAGGGDLLAANNLSDLVSAATALTNLGLSANGKSLVTAADYAAMKTLLGLVIGTNVQAYHARLADLAGITYAQGDVLYFDGTNIVKLAAGTSGQFLKTQGAGANPLWATIAGGGDLLAANNLSDLVSAATALTNLGLSANGKSLVTAADYAAMKTLLGLVIGTNVQAWDADLDTWATKTAPSGTPVGTTDTQTLSAKTFTNPAMTSQALTDGATINWDADSGAFATVTLGGNRTFAAPTNLKTGGVYVLKLTQDATGGRNPTWNAVFKNLPQVDLVPSSVTVLDFISDGTNLYYAGGMPSMDEPLEIVSTSATPAPTAIINGLNYIITALDQAATIGVPGGSPKQGYKLIYRITDNGTARALTWNAVYNGSLLPSTTVVGKTTYVGLKYNSDDEVYDCVAVVEV